MFGNRSHSDGSTAIAPGETHGNCTDHLIELRRVQKIYSTAAGP